MSSPLVSVVIPTYNQPALLREAINSALAQTLTDREIVIINDGSTDDTLSHLADYGSSIRIITQQNQGIGAARNRGIDESLGKYVALLDHDDYWMPQKLALQVDLMEREPSCIAATVPYASSYSPDKPIVNPRDICGSDRIIRNPLAQMEHGPILATSALLFARKPAASVRYGTVRGAIEDVQFHLGLISRGNIGVAGDEVLAVWRQHASNSSKASSYTYAGIKLLRAMDAHGQLGQFTGEQRRDLEKYLGHLGRVATVGQLIGGERLRGLELYCREWFHQARLQRFAFLAAFPMLVAAPTKIIRRRFAVSAPVTDSMPSP